jgi:hypothetical protein
MNEDISPTSPLDNREIILRSKALSDPKIWAAYMRRRQSQEIAQWAFDMMLKGEVESRIEQSMLDGGWSPEETMQGIEAANLMYAEYTKIEREKGASLGMTSMSGFADRKAEHKTEDLEAAKANNIIPFRNYVPVEEEILKRGKPVKEVVKHPRGHQDMLKDMKARLLGFPCKIGASWLFDHDRDSGEIHNINGADALVAWISRKSKHNAEFTRGDGFVSPYQFFSSVEHTARRYEAISDVPDWPIREQVYYTHGEIPPPCPKHSRLEGLVDFFRPATPEDRCCIRALICAPIFFIPGIDRPSWVIDSRDGQGCGKSNLGEIVGELYGAAPISTSKYEISNRMDVLVKRLVSERGRKARILMVDNVTGDFQSPELADLITRKDITGIPPYGRGEEVRPNNLTVIITANTATVGTDIADRSIYIHIRRPDQDWNSVTWKSRVMAYIKNNRLEIFADIMDLLLQHKRFESIPQTRFKPWEVAILQPCCENEEMYLKVLTYIKAQREDSNIEADQARAVVDHFTAKIMEQTQSVVPRPVFLRTEVVNSWGRAALNDSMDVEFKGRPIQLIRNLVKMNFIPQADRDIKRWPTSGRKTRYSGIAWNFDGETKEALVVSRDANGVITTAVM